MRYKLRKPKRSDTMTKSDFEEAMRLYRVLYAAAPVEVDALRDVVKACAGSFLGLETLLFVEASHD